MTPIKLTGAKTTKHPGIKKLAEGRWYVKMTWVDERTGRRMYRERVVIGTLVDAQRVRASLRGQEKNVSNGSRPRFRGFAETWLERAKRKIEPSTYERYTADVANLSLAFGDWWVHAIDYDALEKWQADMQELESVPDSDPPAFRPKYAAATINGWHRTMRLILDRAVRMRLLVDNPARDLSTLTEGRTKGARGTPLSAEGLRAFIEAIPRCVEKKKISADAARGVYVYAWTGMRAGEIIALDWQHVVDGELNVEHSVWRGIKKTDKTDDPRRIPIAEPLASVLEEQRRWLLAKQHPGLESGLVFPANPKQARAGAARRKGSVHWYRSQTTFQDAVSAVCEEAKVTRVSPHALRRTFEDLLRKAGVEGLVRRAMAGWRSDRTQGIYATVSKDDRSAATGAVVKLVLG